MEETKVAIGFVCNGRHIVLNTDDDIDGACRDRRVATIYAESENPEGSEWEEDYPFKETLEASMEHHGEADRYFSHLRESDWARKRHQEVAQIEKEEVTEFERIALEAYEGGRDFLDAIRLAKWQTTPMRERLLSMPGEKLNI